jgi:hypothetical protein
MTDKIALEDWIYREAQYTPDGYYIWRNDHKAARERALREALRVLPEDALSLLGITIPENRTCDFDHPDSRATANDNGFDDYFGVCPHCHKHDGFINIGRGHWFYCREHKVKWCAGSNLSSSWRNETEGEQRKIYDELGFGEFKHIAPWHRRKVTWSPPPPPASPGHFIDDDMPF